MRKTAIFLFFLLALTFISNCSALTTPIKTMCMLLGVANPDVEDVAAFDAFFCDFHYNYASPFDIASDINAIVTANSDIKTYGYMNPLAATDQRAYWSVLNSHEDWFIHRTDNGSRVYDSAWNQWIMNITNTDYQTWFVAWTNSKINDGNLSVPFTGVLYDNVNVALSNVLSPPVLAVVDADYVSNFYTYYIDFLQATVPSIDGEVIINSEECLGPLHMYLDEVAGELCERIGHPAFGASYNDAASNLNILEQMEYAAANGKRFFAVGGDDEFVSGSDVNQFCYCTFAVAAYPEAYFDIGAPGSLYNQIYTDPVMFTDLGANSSIRYANGTGWTRTFASGYVTVNFEEFTSEIIFTEEAPTPTSTAAPYVPPETSFGSGSGFDSLIGLCAVLAVFAIIIWPFLPKDRRPF